MTCSALKDKALHGSQKKLTYVHFPQKCKLQNEGCPDFQSRYLLEDVPTGLVVSAGIARLADVPVPTIDDVILTTSAWMGKQYLRNGDFIGSDILQTRLPQNVEIKDLDRLKKVVVAGSLI